MTGAERTSWQPMWYKGVGTWEGENAAFNNRERQEIPWMLEPLKESGGM